MCTSQVEGPELGTLGHASLLDLLGRALDTVRRLPLSGAVDDRALTAGVEALHRIENRAAAEKLRWISEVDTREAWRAEGHRSTADLLSERLHVTKGEARAHTETAATLETMPETAGEVAAGRMSAAQARIAARTAAQVPQDARDELDRLVAAAGDLDTRQLQDHVNTWIQTAAPDVLAERERRARANRRAALSTTFDGMTKLEAWFEPVGGATVRAELERRARKTGPDDDRTYEQRLADAIVDLSRHAPSAPAGGGSADASQDGAPAAPHAQVIVIAETGPDGTLDKARLDGFGPISPATAEQLACDAEITHVIMHRNGDVLDVGRTRRDPTKGQRIAVIARDKTCVGAAPPSRAARFTMRDGGPATAVLPTKTTFAWSVGAATRASTTTGTPSPAIPRPAGSRSRRPPLGRHPSEMRRSGEGTSSVSCGHHGTQWRKDQHGDQPVRRARDRLRAATSARRVLVRSARL